MRHVIIKRQKQNAGDDSFKIFDQNMDFKKDATSFDKGNVVFQVRSQSPYILEAIYRQNITTEKDFKKLSQKLETDR